MRVKIAEAVKATKTVEIEVRPDLFASKCDGCGKLFVMNEFCNDDFLGELRGTFEHCAAGPDGRSMGNTFSATVCNFKCAHEVFANGGWRKIERYKPYADADIRLVRAELKITVYVEDETKLLKAWEATDNTGSYPSVMHSGRIVVKAG